MFQSHVAIPTSYFQPPQDALGGNAKTVLLATVSPLAANMAETLTTLRFAHRAKSIVNMAVVNTAPPGLLRGGHAPTAAELLESKASEEGCEGVTHATKQRR